MGRVSILMTLKIMTNKKKHEISMKLNKLRQIIVILLMIMSGIWYVTKGREHEAVSYISSSTADLNNIKKSTKISERNQGISQSENSISNNEEVIPESDQSILNNQGISQSGQSIINSDQSISNGSTKNTDNKSENESENINTYSNNINHEKTDLSTYGSPSDSNLGDSSYGDPNNSSQHFIYEDNTISSSHSDSNLINLNRATLEELDSLPGVGPATAQNIIDYREQYGGFAAIEEIKNVKRIGDKTFEKLKDHITV